MDLKKNLAEIKNKIKKNAPVIAAATFGVTTIVASTIATYYNHKLSEYEDNCTLVFKPEDAARMKEEDDTMLFVTGDGVFRISSATLPNEN